MVSIGGPLPSLSSTSQRHIAGDRFAETLHSLDSRTTTTWTTTRHRQEGDMAGGISNTGPTGPIDVEVRYVEASGQLVTTTRGKVDGSEVVRGRGRRFPTYPGQQNYRGWLWTATTGSLIGYVSPSLAAISGPRPTPPRPRHPPDAKAGD